MSTTNEATTETGLTIIKPDGFIALNDSAEMREALQAANEAGENITPGDLIRVPTPAGGATRWVITNPVKEEHCDEITGVLVYYQPVGILWPGTDPTPGALPVLRTFSPSDPNGTAEQIGPIPDAMAPTLEKHRVTQPGVAPALFNWPNLPYNQWGSGKGGNGKLCKEQRQMYILRPNDVFPLLVTAQPGSVKSVSKFFKMLTATARVPYFRCVVTLRLEKALNRAGQPFARIVPSLAGVLPSDTGEVVREKWTNVLKTVARKLDVVADDAGSDEE